MAKKVRRVRKPHTNQESSPSKKNGAKKRQNPTEMFRQEYAYVLKDLRQVLILAVLMFALLIALNLFLQ